MQPTAWHTLSSEAIAQQLEVTPAQGLSSAEVEQRLQKYGLNVMAEEKKEPYWLAFLKQYKDYMRIVLTIAAVASLLIGEYSTAILLLIITAGNAWMALHQESKAEDSVAALGKMMKSTARVRRDGQATEISAEGIVPGDIALFEAGDRVPADGRLLVAATLEIDESALTGESTPVLKDTASIGKVDAPLGDRLDMGYMNCNVTRGRGEMLVTGTGMDTEVGHIAGMLQSAEVEKSPLTKQIDGLTVVIASLAGIALVLIILIGLGYGASFQDLYIMGIALAIAAIPTGLPIVVTTILAMGATEMARRGAIIKRLPAVETLGSTSAICSDKTGTLTLNQMTSRELIVAGRQYSVTGHGYKSDGEIRRIGGVGETDLDPILMPMALCSDAVVQDGELVGDPTEGALVVLAQKGGIMVRSTREAFPRVAEVPFDSAYKLMATFHNMTNSDGQPVVRCYVKGAPDVLIARSSTILGADGKIDPLDKMTRQQALEHNEQLAGKGMRVMVVASRDLDPDTFDPDADLLPEVNQITLLGMVGIVDPPRPEAKVAIAESLSAGIRVRMITGDHAVTAAAIAGELGIEGRAITGAEFAAMNDEEAANQIDDIGVIARVAPEDKVRLVKVLKAKNNIVAMTGDGVNDAPALKTADIGVAMGITGTDVSKEAAVMILTDDNFATIVEAVDYGRVIYDNLLKYLRFQMAGLFGFILAFLGASALGITLVLFAPLQILFVNYFVQGAIGVNLGFDSPTPGLMKRNPRPADEKIMKMPMWIRIFIIGVVAAIFAILAYQWTYSTTDSQIAAQSMAMVMFSIIHIPISLGLRHPKDTVFRAETFSNKNLLLAYGWVVLVLVLVTELPLLQRVFETQSLTPQQWGICLIAAVLFLLVGEILKVVLRLFSK
ncbi:MAG: cation-translocating P-type ATPase [Halieaceae bacterium]|nr:cation-translocating P-type ATPase [Halieaceae bacterium]